MTLPDRDAIALLHRHIEYVALDETVPFYLRQKAIFCLHHAIKHLAYPDRDIYPKVRRFRKTDPVRRAGVK